MAFYSLVNVTPTTDTWIPDYIPAANALVAKHSGKYLARTASHSQLEGAEAPAALRVLIEWPSKGAAEAFMSDAEYTPHLAARQDGSDSVHFLIEGVDDMA
ncbi:MAG: DUF1330 domain-containing protein [Paracoccaceae bacterium]